MCVYVYVCGRIRTALEDPLSMPVLVLRKEVATVAERLPERTFPFYLWNRFPFYLDNKS